MNLSDALGDWPSGGNNQSGAWPGQPAGNPSWPGGQPAGNPTWPGGQPAGNPTWPGCQPGGQPGGWPSPGPGKAAPQTSLAVPYSQSLPSGVFDKMLITIAGNIKPNANKITVDMSTSHDLAFHFNPRFNENGKKVIVRNTRMGDKWGKEERDLQHFPFVQGQAFEIKILCTNREFKVAVNNNHLLEYKHRITDLRAINNLKICNDLTLSRVNVETLP